MFLPRKEDPKVEAQGWGLFLHEWWKQPLGKLLQNSAHVWAYVILPRCYLGTPDEIVCGGTAFGGEEVSTDTVAAAVPGYAGASGGSQSLVRATATVLSVAAATTTTTTAAAAAATAAAVTVAVTAAVIVTAAATATVPTAAVTTAAATAVVTAVTAATATAATGFKAFCPGAE